MDKNILEGLIDQGMSIPLMANHLDRKTSAVRYWMDKYKLKTSHDSRIWTDADMIKALINNLTIADVLRDLGLQVRPGNYTTVKRFVKKHFIDLSHMTGKAHGTSVSRKKRPLEEVFVEKCTLRRHNVKKRIMKEGLLRNECSIEGCSIKDDWMGRKIVMVLDHINGINDDCRLSNLRLLCPNCNSQQKTFCRKN